MTKTNFIGLLNEVHLNKVAGDLLKMSKEQIIEQVSLFDQKTKNSLIDILEGWKPKFNAKFGLGDAKPRATDVDPTNDWVQKIIKDAGGTPSSKVEVDAPTRVDPIEPKPPSKITAGKIATGAGLAGLGGYVGYKAFGDDEDTETAAADDKSAETPEAETPEPKAETPEPKAEAPKPQDYDSMSFGDAFKAARKAAKEKGVESTGRFKYKGKEYQTNVKGEKYVTGKNQTSVDESMLAAFNQVVNSKHPNLFAEAAKKNASEASEPKNEKEKKLAALAEPKDKITHKDVLVGRGVKQVNEAAVPLNHKEALIKHYGPGKVTINKKDGMISHTDNYGETNSHAYDPNEKQPIGHHVGTITVAEEIGFSEAELAHFASIVEGMPVAPTPEDQAPNPSPKNKAEGGKGKGSLAETKDPPEKRTPNELHMNAKRAADGMTKIKHKFENGELVNMTQAMGDAFLKRHKMARTSDEKDSILMNANKSSDNFKRIVQDGEVPKEKEKIKITMPKIRTMMKDD